MQLGNFLIALLVFVFSVFLFVPLQNAAQNVNATDPLAPVVQSFPLIFVVVTAIFPIYFLIEGKNK